MVNKKGQAAATDALIFLGIVSVVFVMIIGYTMNYGTGILGSAKKLYMSNYEFTSLKVFFTADYGRDGKPLASTEGMDSVAIMIKEDYGTNGTVSKTTKQAMLGILDSIFLPLPQRSYLMYIQHEVTSGSGSIMQPLVVVLRTVNPDGQRLYYDCNPLEDKPIIDYLGLHSFDLEVAEGKFLLFSNIVKTPACQQNPFGCDMKKEDGIVYLASWISAPETTDIANSDFKCTEFVFINS